jgi:queuine tRNA-ribosyltransferase
MSAIKFTITQKIPGFLGRAGTIETPHGTIETPAFIPVATKATIKALTPEQVRELGADAILSNTYHLYLQPGDTLIRDLGGLHKFANWNKPMFTDSGGFQVFSLGAAFGKEIGKLTKSKEPELILPGNTEDGVARLAQIDSDGVMFRSHINGDAHYFTPEKSIEIQHNLGADIIFAFDECTSPNEPLHYQKESLERTHRWAKRCVTYHKGKEASQKQGLFGVVQGGRFKELREESARALAEMDFDGYGIGGSFSKDDIHEAVGWVNAILPEEKPRHLLGIGEPEDLFSGVENGCDTFDCVAPTRNARNGGLYTHSGKINITNNEFLKDPNPIEEGCGCYTCKNYSCAYVAHLFKAHEMLAGTLGTIHNLYFIVNLVKKIRASILEGRFFEYKKSFFEEYKKVSSN